MTRPAVPRPRSISTMDGALPTIRQFRIQDLDRVLRIEKESFGRRAWNADLFRRYAEECPECFLVAKVGRVIAAYSITRIRGRRAELDSIAVAKAYRNRGVGGAFLRFVIAEVQRAGCDALALMVRRDNETAIRFYRSLGFKRLRTVPNYYEGGETAWRMEFKVRGASRPVVQRRQ